MHVAMPKVRDAVVRPPVIPAGVAEARARRDAGERRRTEKDLQEEHGGAGVYSSDDRKRFLLAEPSWRYDVVPEIIGGHNVADFVDPDIDARLAELEREEDELEALHAATFGADMGDEGDELDEEQVKDLAAIRHRKRVLVTGHRLKKGTANNRAVVPHATRARTQLNTNTMRQSLESMGLDASAAVGRARARSASRVGRKRTRSLDSSVAGGDMELDGSAVTPKRLHSSKSRSMSRGRALSVAEPRSGSGLKDSAQVNKAVKLADKSQYKRNKMAKAGEADRVIQTKMPKHLFSGKRGNGKTDRR